jgi:indole-3-glycerol phosphate synthase
MHPAEVAGEYVVGGAIGMSVLTDEPFFQGSLADLTDAASVAHVAEPPVAILRKDFVIDEYQLLEARAAGADAVLLIVAALDQGHLIRLHESATKVGLDALVEVHTADEMARAADAGATLIGINNRDLHTFSVDLAVSERLAARRPTGSLIVAESGIASRSDVARLVAVGVDAILVGESLVLSPDRSAAIRDLRGA